jgi:hypothetical protein
VAQMFGLASFGPMECMILLGLGVLLFGRDLGKLVRLKKRSEFFWILVCYYLAASCRELVCRW